MRIRNHRCRKNRQLNRRAFLETCGFCREVHLADNRPLDSLQTLPKSASHTLDVTSTNGAGCLCRTLRRDRKRCAFYLNKTIAAACADLERSYFDLTGRCGNHQFHPRN